MSGAGGKIHAFLQYIIRQRACGHLLLRERNRGKANKSVYVFVVIVVGRYWLKISDRALGDVMPTMEQGSAAKDVRTCRYQTWHDMLVTRGDYEKASEEYERCIRMGLWEKHAGVVYVMIDVEMVPGVVHTKS